MSNIGYEENFRVRVALGQVPGWETFRKFGMNDAVTSGTEFMWPPGTARVLPTSNTVAAVVSDSADDDANPAGTGAWTVVVEGLDADGLEVSDTVSLDGITPVNTTQVFSRINRAYNTTAGTGEVNAGNISISLDSGKLQAYIEAGEGQTQQVLYTVPSNKTLLLDRIALGTGRLGAVDLAVQVFVMLPGQTAWRAISNIQPYESQFLNEGAVLAPSSAELKMICVSSGNGEAFGILSGYLIKNENRQT
jgi:hypothetical protein